MESPVFALIVLAVGFTCTRVAAIYWQIIFCLFGAAAAVTMPNGAVITPSNLFLPFLVARAWSENMHSGYVKRVPKAGLWLALAALYGILVAFFIPRALEGQFAILAADRSGAGLTPQPIRPVSTNFTQSVYAVAGVVSFLTFRALLDRAGRLVALADAILLLTALNCAAGVITIAEFYLGFPPILTYVRNAYALFDAYEGAGGLVRIHGTFSEASAYAAFSAPLFAFAFSSWLHGVRSAYSGYLAALQLLLLLISTSSTAYAGLLIYGTILASTLAYRGYVGRAGPRFGLLLVAGLLAAAAALSIFAFETRIGQQLTDYFDITLFNKLQSSSGLERSDWNHRAWQNLLDSAGIGVGLGTARASSFIFVVLSNLGVIGSWCYVMFLVAIFRGGPNQQREQASVKDACSQGVLAALAFASLAASVYDLGILFYALAAGASSPGRGITAHRDAMYLWPGAGRPAHQRPLHASPSRQRGSAKLHT